MGTYGCILYNIAHFTLHITHCILYILQKESRSTVPKEVSQEDNEETKETDNKRALDDSCHTLDSLFRGDYYDVSGGRQQ